MNKRFTSPLEGRSTFPFASQLVRRVLSALTLLGYVCALTGGLLEYGTLAWVGLAVLLLGGTATSLSTSSLLDKRERDQDEWSRSTRDAAYRSSYRLWILLLSVLGSILLWWPGVSWPQPFYGTLTLIIAYFLFLALPNLWLAWTIPEVPQDDLPTFSGQKT